MKRNLLKICLICMLSCYSFSSRSQVNNVGSMEQLSIEQFVDILNGIDGYIFIGVGEEEKRDISVTLAREIDDIEPDDFRALNWSSLNPSIASVNEDGLIRGESYGETIIQGKSADGKTDIGYVVFVCPKVTIYSPEGAIYSYHKIFNQKTRVQFTGSKDYKINAVYRDAEEIPCELDKDGWYESKDDETVSKDTSFYVTMESKTPVNNDLNDKLKIHVENTKVTMIGCDQEEIGVVVITDVNGQMLYKGLWPDDGVVNFDSRNKGIFYVDIPNINTYKILMW